jgi:PIN domain nuclease of toxin-antitoxin system
VVREAADAVNLLPDSHALLWAMHDPDRSTASARTIISDQRRVVYVSAASVWELELKAAKGKLALPNDWLAAAERVGLVELPVGATDAQLSAMLPWHHQDPFDRVLIAQAQRRGLQLASRDPVMAAYEVSLLVV